MARKDNSGKESAEHTEHFEHIERLVPDTSVIIEGIISKKIIGGELRPEQIIFHEASLAELEHQANLGKASGMLGIEEISKIKTIAEEKGILIEFSGRRPTHSEIRYAKMGEIDSLIRDLAYEKDATLYTADKVQAEIARAKGMKFIIARIVSRRELKLDVFFDENTMSVHLRENVIPMSKKGRPGQWTFNKIRESAISQDELKELSREILEEASVRKDGFIEIERQGSTIVQLGNFRIVMTRPPLSDGWEITAVRPVKHLSLPDYSLSDKLKKKISEEAEGILIAGAPGQGKSTFAQALAEFYAAEDKVVKTVEAPRDLVLPDTITQYAISHGSSEEIHDILLLVRPDYTIFDEMRNTKDFALFSDLRLAGVGMVGVVHGTNPVDAVQRFIGRIELGVIPQVIDTVIFIKNGTVFKVLSLKMQVKVPSGMIEEDLARPIVTVSDFETGKLEFEIYSYGEETVVVPVQDQKGGGQKPMHKLAKKEIEKEFLQAVDEVLVEVVSDNKCLVYVPEDEIGRVVGKGGENINRIEKKLGMSIDIKPLSGERRKKQDSTGREELAYDVADDKKALIFYVDEKYREKPVSILLNGEFVLSVAVGKKGAIKIKKSNQMGKIIENAMKRKEDLKLVI